MDLILNWLQIIFRRMCYDSNLSNTKKKNTLTSHERRKILLCPMKYQYVANFIPQNFDLLCAYQQGYLCNPFSRKLM